MIRYAFKCSLTFVQKLRKFDNNKIFNAKTGGGVFCGGGGGGMAEINFKESPLISC